MNVAVVGARGFVGSAVCRALRRLGIEPVELVRGRDLDRPVDVLVNASSPGARLAAEKRPERDFVDTVGRTARLYYHYGIYWRRFLQVSSVSARFPQNSVYGRHRLIAEQLVRNGLVVRLGPMYGAGLTKGYLIDAIEGRPIYADPDTRYAYADVDWVGDEIARLALSDRIGTVEVGGSGWITLRELGTEFRPSEFFPREDQVFLSDDGPDSRLVLDWVAASTARTRSG